jgi:hypothetical protein
MKKNKIHQIFEQWSASLRERDRSKDAVSANFDDLFQSFKDNGFSAEEAYEYIPHATKSHLPSDAIARNTYKKLKNVVDKNEKEFIDEWKKGIHDKAVNSYYGVFPLEEVEKQEEKRYGSMSEKEYKAYRKYAESFPILDTRNLEKEMEERMLKLKEDLDKFSFVEDLLEKKDGN